MQWRMLIIHLVPFNSHIRHAYPLTIVYSSQKKEPSLIERIYLLLKNWIICFVWGCKSLKLVFIDSFLVAEQHAIHNASASTLHELHDLLVNKRLRVAFKIENLNFM